MIVTIIVLSLLIFFTGYFLAPTIYKHKVKILLFYPLWITKKLEHFISKKLKFQYIFILIFFFNSFTLLLILISGILPFLPIILICWLGINLGVSIFHLSGKNHYFMILINPVAILEIIATIITGSLSIELSLQKIFKILNIKIPDHITFIESITFLKALNIFLHITLPILFIAAIIETLMIIMMKNKSKGINI